MASSNNLFRDTFGDATRDAAEKFKRSLTAEHERCFASTELKEVWDEVRKIESTQRKRKMAQNMRRIEPFLTGLEQYTKVIEVLCNGTPFMPYAWAPIKLMLQLASDHRDIFEALLEAYAEIGAALPRFDRYQQTFKDNPEFQGVLIGVYSTILDFHQRAYKLFQRRAWYIIFMSLWKDFRARFKNIIHTLEKHRDFVDKEAASIGMFEDKVTRTMLLKDIEERRKQALESLDFNEKTNSLIQLQSAISWLSADDRRQEAEHLRRSLLRHPGTCEWICTSEQIKDWLKDDNKNPIFWMNGKPGAGKSTMCAYLIETLYRSHELNVCFYFCNDQSDGNDSPCERIMGVIATQLLRSHPELATLVVNEFVSQGMSSGLAKLRILVPKLLKLQPGTRIIIDGLDETSKRDQVPVLHELQDICVSAEIRCKVLISSRKEPGIKNHLSKIPNLSLDHNQDVAVDIQLYVSSVVEALRSNFEVQLEPCVLSSISSSLIEKADGMFLWVKLMAKELHQCFMATDLLETVKSLPYGLEEAYDRILKGMLDPALPPHVRSISIRILEWMSYAHRPLQLYELLDGVTLQPNRLNLEEKLERRVLELCWPLIEEGPSGSMTFVHFSAKKYILEHNYKDERPFVRIEDANLNITFSCVAYLNTSIILLPKNSTEEQQKLRILKGLHDLHTYSSQFWLKHLAIYIEQVQLRKLEIPQYLIAQLQELLNFRDPSKNKTQAMPPEETPRSIGKDGISKQLEALLNGLPEFKRLFFQIESFRTRMGRQEWTRKAPEQAMKESCDADNTYFSMIRYQYQSTLETLLSLDASRFPPNVSSEQIQRFRDIYKHSAYVCRYAHCSRAGDGYDSSKEREKHESKHQRKYHCTVDNCVDSAKGFATEGLLKKHNDKYHFVLAHGTSLADAVKSLKGTQTTSNNQPNFLPGELGDMHVLEHFDFDSFLHQDDGDIDDFEFDTSVFLDGGEIGAE